MNTIPIQNATIILGQGDESSLHIQRPSGISAPPVAFGQYWLSQGGIYCGTMPAFGGLPARHLVFSEEEHEGLAWGCYGEDRPDAKHKHDGRANTAALLRAGKHPAAAWAAAVKANGHSDFHLPSQAELMLAWVCAPQAFNLSGYYWASTQDSPDNAFVVDFEYGYSDYSSKGNGHRVRAVRWVPVEETQ